MPSKSCKFIIIVIRVLFIFFLLLFFCFGGQKACWPYLFPETYNKTNFKIWSFLLLNLTTLTSNNDAEEKIEPLQT